MAGNSVVRCLAWVAMVAGAVVLSQGRGVRAEGCPHKGVIEGPYMCGPKTLGDHFVSKCGGTEDECHGRYEWTAREPTHGVGDVTGMGMVGWYYQRLCYRSVRCEWNPSLGECTIEPNDDLYQEVSDDEPCWLVDEPVHMLKK